MSNFVTKQARIFAVLTSLNNIPKVSVTKSVKDTEITEIFVHHQQQYVPDLRLQWCSVKNQFRVYIHIASTKFDKQNAGYCICVINSTLAASALVVMYNFLHSHRANNKEAE